MWNGKKKAITFSYDEGSAGGFVLSNVVGPCFFDIQLTAQHLGQVLVGDVVQLGADVSTSSGAAPDSRVITMLKPLSFA